MSDEVTSVPDVKRQFELIDAEFSGLFSRFKSAPRKTATLVENVNVIRSIQRRLALVAQFAFECKKAGIT